MGFVICNESKRNVKYKMNNLKFKNPDNQHFMSVFRAIPQGGDTVKLFHLFFSFH